MIISVVFAVVIAVVILAITAAGFIFYRIGKEKNFLRQCGGRKRK